MTEDLALTQIAPVWTSQLPTLVGWYWWRPLDPAHRGDEPDMIYVDADSEARVDRIVNAAVPWKGSETYMKISRMGGEWQPVQPWIP